MKKTAGLTTFHISTSIGANLQTYALQESIRHCNIECEIINYNRNYVKKEKEIYNESIKYKVKRQLIKIAVKVNSFFIDKESVEKALLDFRNNYLNISPKLYNTIDELKQKPPIYDYYITGSDQVWNPTTTFLEAYYLTFAPNDKKTIAYAPSIGISVIPEKYKPIMREYISHVHYLSCRENVGAQQLSQLMGSDVVNVLDPTFLLTPDDYNTIAVEPTIKKPYLLCYFLGSMKFGRKIAEKVARKLGLQIVVIPSSPADLFFLHKKMNGIGPKEFLGLIKNASFVCTDSFHGLALSLNYNKRFLAFTRRNAKGEFSNASRLESITSILGVERWLLTPEDKFNDDLLTIDFNKINSLLSKQRDLSFRYLKNALNGDCK